MPKNSQLKRPEEILKEGCQMVCFQTKNKHFWHILGGLAMENCGIFHLHSVYFVIASCVFSVLVYCTNEDLATLF
jgi:hypothetical protein